ncbi:hypothetical protein TNCV_2044401 [Trichonephila clavipes]|nr:hypothetical protein TNCV_2044401 [Trichonephila clavipes]
MMLYFNDSGNRSVPQAMSRWEYYFKLQSGMRTQFFLMISKGECCRLKCDSTRQTYKTKRWRPKMAVQRNLKNFYLTDGPYTPEFSTSMWVSVVSINITLKKAQLLEFHGRAAALKTLIAKSNSATRKRGCKVLRNATGSPDR